MIQNLQGLRGLAALLVVFVHLEALLHTAGIAPFGWSGVDLFFVISGFVMVHTTRTRPTTALDFAKNRIARIVPIYWLITLAVFAVALVAPSLMQATTADPVSLLKSLFFIPFQKANGLVQPVLFVGWTLNYEMFFYALFALGLMVRRYDVGLALTSTGIAALVLAGAAFQPQGVLAKFYTNPIMLEFVLGMGVALLAPKVPAQAGRFARGALLAVVVMAFVAVVVAPLAIPKVSSLFTAGLPATIVVLGALTLEKWGWRLNNRLWIALGDASYVLYLSHPFVTQAVQKVVLRFEPQGAVTLALVAMTLVLVSIVALVLHQWVEKPLSKVARRLVAPRPGPVAPGYNGAH